MKKIFFIALLYGSAQALMAQQVKPMKIGELEDYIASRPHPVVINFWATWCGPCLEEMPSFNKTTSLRNNEKIELVFVSLDSRNAFPGRIESTAKKAKINGTLVWLNETDANMFCPRIDPSWNGSIPATLFVNNQKQRRKFLEEQLTATRLKKEIHQLTQ